MLDTPQAREFERTVMVRLGALAGRVRLYVFADGLAILLFSLLAFVVVQLGLDSWLRLPWDMRLCLSALGAVMAAYVGWRFLIKPARRAVSASAVALVIERRFPQLGDRLISALQFVEPGLLSADPDVASPTLMNEVVTQASATTRSLRFSEALNHRRALRQAGIAGACLLVFAGSWFLAPGTMTIWLQRNVLLSRHVEWPQRTRLAIVGLQDGRLIHPAGDDLQISATAAGEIPSVVELEYEPRSTSADSGLSGGELRMVRVGQTGFRATFPDLRSELRARARGGDAVTGWFDVILVERPRVIDAQMAVAPPAYTGMTRYELRAGQTVAEALRGSEITLNVVTNKPIATAELWADGAMVQALPGAPRQNHQSARMATRRRRYLLGATGRNHLTATFTPTESRTYHFQLTDENRLSNRRPVRFTVRIVSDRPPRVELRIPGLGEMVTPQATLPLAIEMADSYGLGAAQLVYQITDLDERADAATSSRPASDASSETAVSLAGFEVASKSFVTSLDYSLTALGLEPGQRFALWARAADQDTVGGPNVGKSIVYSMRVVAADELLAELSRREQEYRREFERLTREQESLRGQLLSTLNQVQSARDDAGKAAVRRAYARHERVQQALARRVLGIQRQFEQILGEMEINHIAAQSIRVRLANRIIQPLETLGRKQMPAAEDRLGAASRNEPDLDLATIDPQQAEIGQSMRQILSQMLQWEGFHEAVGILRDIIKSQESLNRETEEELQRRIQEIFGTNRPPGASN